MVETRGDDDGVKRERREQRASWTCTITVNLDAGSGQSKAHHTPCTSSAMQSLSRTAYSDAFGYSDPKATSNLLKARMAAAKEVNERLAQYFSERSEVGRHFSLEL